MANTPLLTLSKKQTEKDLTILHGSKSRNTSAVYVRFLRRWNFDWITHVYIQSKKVSEQNSLPLFQTLQRVQSKSSFLGLQDIFWGSLDWHPTKQKPQVNTIKKHVVHIWTTSSTQNTYIILSNMKLVSVKTWNVSLICQRSEININMVH